MHLVRTQFAVTPGGAGEFEAGIAKLGEMRKGQPGYLGQALLHSYGSPHKYVVHSRWDNVEAVWAFNKSQILPDLMKSTPAGLFTITNQEGFESVFEVDADNAQAATSTCEVLADWTLNQAPGVFARFERTRREFFELRKKHVKGFVSNRLRRSADTPNRYLGIAIYTDVAAARAGLPPEVQVWAAAQPYTLYASTPPVLETYHVVQRM